MAFYLLHNYMDFIEELLIIREQKVILFPIVVKGFLFFIVFFVI